MHGSDRNRTVSGGEGGALTEGGDGRQPSAKEELATLVESLRAHAEWQRETGATGLPRSAKKTASKPVKDPSASREPPAPVQDAVSAPPLARAELAVPEDPAARKARLIDLAGQARVCEKCDLCRGRKQAVFARGNPSAELCFVGEGPGADEDEQGEPFVGRAGQLLDKMIVAMGYARDEVYICNIVKCRPPNNRKPEPTEAAACRPYLTEQLALVAPKVIVALGGTAVEGLLGVATAGITRTRGQWKLYRASVPVMPTFHPAYLLRNPPAKRDVWNDLQAVMKLLGKPTPSSAR
jgi:uracil-DNA glycosylase